MANVPVPGLSVVTPASGDTVVGVKGGLVKRYAVGGVGLAGLGVDQTFSGSQTFTGKVFWRNPSALGTPPIAKELGDGRSGVIEVIHNDNTGYLMHLLAGSSMTSPAAMIGIGMDNGNGNGLLIAKKAAGVGVAIDQQATVTDPTAYGVHAVQKSTSAALVRLEQQVNSGAPLLQLLSFSSAVDSTQLSLYVGDKDGEAGVVFSANGEMRWRRNVTIQDKNGSTVSRSIWTSDGGVAANQKTETWISKMGIEQYTYSGSPGVWFATRIFPQSGGMKLQCAATTGTIGTATFETMIDVRRNQLGFYGTTAINKPTVSGSRGGNAALASLLTQLAALGLITDGTTA